jgi:sulfite reductase (ferredoxin)
MAARLKFLIKNIGADEYMRLLHEEWKSLINQTYTVDTTINTVEYTEPKLVEEPIAEEDKAHFELWKSTNVFVQKQEGYSSVGMKVLIGNIDTDQARKIAAIAEELTGDDFRVTISQNLLFRFVPNQNIPALYNRFKALGLHDAGYESILDITSCPGTDTCNLGVASSMGVTKALENVLRNEYPQLIKQRNLLIKVSGCMNSCGQHVIANIGFQGMSTPVGKNLAPAFQVLLGGCKLSNGDGRFAEKSLKVFSKRAPQALKALLDDYATNSTEGESYNDYYDRQGAKYFHPILTPFGDKNAATPDVLIDWDAETAYEKAVGVGECAGVMIDLVQTIFVEADEKLDDAELATSEGRLADAAYHIYSAFIQGAKALLVSIGARTNTQKAIIDTFDKEFVETGKVQLQTSYADTALKLTQQVPDAAFIQQYIAEGRDFIKKVRVYRASEVKEEA